jgi:hypothetical protein
MALYFQRCTTNPRTLIITTQLMELIIIPVLHPPIIRWQLSDGMIITGNGAFIIKDSSGPFYANGGYIYVSYYDTKIARAENCVFNNAENTDNYDHKYEYDPLGYTSWDGFNSTIAWLGNIYTASSSQKIAAASFYTIEQNTSYLLRIYKNPNNGPVNTSGPVLTQTGSFTNAGYHTVNITGTLPSVSNGQTFSVVVRLTCPTWTSPIAVEQPIQYESSTATANSGESYVSSNGTTWTDMTSRMTNTNVCLKAFTYDDTRTVTTPVIKPAGGRYAVGTVVSMSTTTSGATIYYTTDGTDPTTSSNQYTAPFTQYGDATIKAKAFKTGWNTSGVTNQTYDIYNIFYVSPMGNDFFPGLSWGTAKATINNAISFARYGDEVWVASGTYFENVDVPAGISIYGGFNGTELMRWMRDWTLNNTIIDGGGISWAVRVQTGAFPTDTHVDGFGITNGYYPTGGGIYLMSNASPTIAHNCIYDNTAYGTFPNGKGGGIYSDIGAPVIKQNKIYLNTAETNGGGIEIENGLNPMIENNLIYRNHALNDGGGVSVDVGGGVTLRYNTIVQNNANLNGGGYNNFNAAVTIYNTIFYRNNSGIYFNGGALSLLYNCVFGNTMYNYMNIPPGIYDLIVDPMLVNIAASDFHLLPISPCINAGLSVVPWSGEVDFDGWIRQQSGFSNQFEASDIGAYEVPVNMGIVNTIYLLSPITINFGGTVQSMVGGFLTVIPLSGPPVFIMTPTAYSFMPNQKINVIGVKTTSSVTQMPIIAVIQPDVPVLVEK